jgi:uncharacterized protein YbjT (DUF2867 family)
LCPTLVEAGVAVRAMTRRPDRYRGAGTPVRADAADAASVRAALEGCEAAYYLVHSLASADFETKDAAAARVFGRAAAEAGVTRIVYLGGLGADGDVLSAHLRSRRQVEALLGEAGVPVTTVRAGIIVGHGGISWEITAAGRAPAGDDHAAVGADSDAADRGRGRDPLPGRSLAGA